MKPFCNVVRDFLNENGFRKCRFEKMKYSFIIFRGELEGLIWRGKIFNDKEQIEEEVYEIWIVSRYDLVQRTKVWEHPLSSLSGENLLEGLQKMLP